MVLSNLQIVYKCERAEVVKAHVTAALLANWSVF